MELLDDFRNTIYPKEELTYVQNKSVPQDAGQLNEQKDRGLQARSRYPALCLPYFLASRRRWAPLNHFSPCSYPQLAWFIFYESRRNELEEVSICLNLCSITGSLMASRTWWSMMFPFWEVAIVLSSLIYWTKQQCLSSCLVCTSPNYSLPQQFYILFLDIIASH